MKLNLPQEVTAMDYHEFGWMQDFLRSLGLNVYVTEVGFSEGQYHAVVHDNSQTQTQFVDALRQEFKEAEEF